MIKVELGTMASPGVWEFSVPSLGLSGRSRQPLLDACRLIKQALGPTRTEAGLYRGEALALSCDVEFGATQTVSETNTTSPHFVKYRPFEGIKEAT